MTKSPKDIGASVRARLLRLARERGEDFQLVLTRYANERLLYRLASSEHASRFVLKGVQMVKSAGVISYFSDFSEGTIDGLEDGSFGADDLQCGSFQISIEAPGYLPAVLTADILEADPNVQLVELQAISEECLDEPSEVLGWVIDGATNEFIANALVELHAGVNDPNGALFDTTKTDRDGVFSFPNVPRGYYTVVVDGLGYESGVTRQVSACGGDARYVGDVYLMPTSRRALSFVLNWARPGDLDLRLMLPTGDEVSFDQCAGSLTEEPYAAHDVDHRAADGPESVSIAQPLPGTYLLVVHNFSDQNEEGVDEPLRSSEADIVVYKESEFYAQYFVPKNGSGFFWDVVELQYTDDEWQIVPVNTLTDDHANPAGEDEYTATCTPTR